MAHSFFQKTLLFIFLISSYNPVTTYVFNATGFFGAIYHQIFMVLGWFVLVLFNVNLALRNINHANFLILVLLLVVGLFSLVNGINNGTFFNSIADIAFLLEVWMFYFAGIIIKHRLRENEIFNVFLLVFIINGIALPLMFIFLREDLYFTLQIGFIRVSRVLDFQIMTGLIFVLYGGLRRQFSRFVFYSLIALFAFANMVGFSRGVWLSLILVVLVEFTFFLTTLHQHRRLKISFSYLGTLCVGFLIAVWAQITYSIFDPFIERMFDFDYNTASVGGRIEAYISLFVATFNDLGTFFVGQGAGAYMPGLRIPASSSPTFFGTVLYIYGVFVFSAFAIGVSTLLIMLFRSMRCEHSPYSKFVFFNFIAHLALLNIFPSVSHFPILGFLIFTSVVSMKKSE